VAARAGLMQLQNVDKKHLSDDDKPSLPATTSGLGAD